MKYFCRSNMLICYIAEISQQLHAAVVGGVDLIIKEIKKHKAGGIDFDAKKV